MNILKKILLLISAFFVVLSPLFFFSSNLNNRRELTLIEKISLSIIKPIQDVYGFISIKSRKWMSDYVELWEAKQELEKLMEENSQIKVELQMQKDLEIENTRLRQLLGLAKNSTLKFQLCEVMSGDPSFLYKNLRISCGKSKGIAIGMGVVSSSGVVGVIMRVFEQESDVLLITDPNSSTDIIVSRNRRRGILSGSLMGDGDSMQLRYTEKGSKIQTGDDIVTSGLTGAFPAGLSVGKVTKILVENDISTQALDILPSVQLDSRIREVLVLLQSSRDMEIIKKIGGDDWIKKYIGNLSR